MLRAAQKIGRVLLSANNKMFSQQLVFHKALKEQLQNEIKEELQTKKQTDNYHIEKFDNWSVTKS
jgi:hypothetical protein